MPRYCKQRNKSSCCPVAIFNAMKWAGMPDSFQAVVPRLIKICQTKPYPAGTSRKQFRRVLHHIFRKAPVDVRICEVGRPNARMIDAHLRRGGAIIVSYGHDKKGDGGHTGLLIPGDRRDRIVGTVNLYGDTPTLYCRPTKVFARRHLSKRKDEYRRAWFLTKI